MNRPYCPPHRHCRESQNAVKHCGFSGVWQSQTFPTGIYLFNNNILQRLRDQFIQQLNSYIDTSPKFIKFRMFKLNFEKENDLISLQPALWIPLCKFKCRNHKLPLQKFRKKSDCVLIRLRIKMSFICLVENVITRKTHIHTSLDSYF